MDEIMDLAIWTEAWRLEGVVVASVDSEIALEWRDVSDNRKRTKSVMMVSDICGP